MKKIDIVDCSMTYLAFSFGTLILSLTWVILTRL